jgi:hypothetical protein
MSKRKWFFKRGNARLSWETLPKWVKWVAVDSTGEVFGYDDKPNLGSNAWIERNGHAFNAIAYIGKRITDWQSLIFERPQPESFLTAGIKFVDADTFAKGIAGLSLSFEVREPCKPALPTITAEEWAAIRMLLPGAEYVAKDKNGDVFAHVGKPIVYRDDPFWSTLSKNIELPSFKDRFASIPWRESLVKYESKMLQEPRFKITCTCGENIMMYDNNETSYLTYKAKCPKCGDVWEIGWNVE